MNDEANAFVQQQISQAHTQMYAEIERQVAERTDANLQSQFQAMEIPMSQNRSQQFAIETGNDRSMASSSKLMQDVDQLKAMIQQERRNRPLQLPTVLSNGEILANLIQNESDMDD